MQDKKKQDRQDKQDRFNRFPVKSFTQIFKRKAIKPILLILSILFFFILRILPDLSYLFFSD